MAKQTWVGSDKVKDVLLDMIPPNTTELYTAVNSVTDEVNLARVGETDLHAKEVAQDVATAEVQIEVENARDGYSSLLAKGNAQDLAMAALVAGSGVVVSGTDTTVGFLEDKLIAGPGVLFSVDSTGGDETLTINTAESSFIYSIIFGG